MDAGTFAPPWSQSWDAWLEWANQLPICVAIGLRCTALDDGGGEFGLQSSAWPLNPNGAVNGGLVIAAVDQAMGVVACGALPDRCLPATATINAAFLRPAFAPLHLRATVRQAGRRLVFVAVDVEDREGRLAVACTSTMAAQSAASPPGDAPDAARVRLNTSAAARANARR
jgi:uncharacterized protein (TIGR00369 family)